MRYLAVGDIHGCFTALTSLAAYVPFRDDDLLITLGDYVNRGPDSCAVLDWLIRRQRHGKLVPLRGNHEVNDATGPGRRRGFQALDRLRR